MNSTIRTSFYVKSDYVAARSLQSNELVESHFIKYSLVPRVFNLSTVTACHIRRLGCSKNDEIVPGHHGQKQLNSYVVVILTSILL